MRRRRRTGFIYYLSIVMAMARFIKEKIRESKSSKEKCAHGLGLGHLFSLSLLFFPLHL